MIICGIDPGSTESAFAVVNTRDCKPMAFEKVPNEVLLADMPEADGYAIEMVASYGMSVGASVFETVRWIGRFEQSLVGIADPDLTYRRDVKLHHCGQTKAKDANIRQALVDRFAPGQPNHGKGTKAQPGWFHGFRADIWQAYALAVLAADRIEGRAGVSS